MWGAAAARARLFSMPLGLQAAPALPRSPRLRPPRCGGGGARSAAPCRPGRACQPTSRRPLIIPAPHERRRRSALWLHPWRPAWSGSAGAPWRARRARPHSRFCEAAPHVNHNLRPSRVLSPNLPRRPLPSSVRAHRSGFLPRHMLGTERFSGTHLAVGLFGPSESPCSLNAIGSSEKGDSGSRELGGGLQHVTASRRPELLGLEVVPVAPHGEQDASHLTGERDDGAAPAAAHHDGACPLA